jgi:hypothetical protein
VRVCVRVCVVVLCVLLLLLDTLQPRGEQGESFSGSGGNDARVVAMKRHRTKNAFLRSFFVRVNDAEILILNLSFSGELEHSLTFNH